MPIAKAGSTLYIRPAAHGSGLGTDWANAGALSAVPTFVAAAQPGACVLIAADDGPYTINASLNAMVLTRLPYQGPVSIFGVTMQSLAPTKALFNGTRQPFIPGVNYPRTDPENDGYDVFYIADGSANIRISWLDLQNQGYCVHFLGNAATVTVTDLAISNVVIGVNSFYQLISGSFTANASTISNLTLKNISTLGTELGTWRNNQQVPNFTLDTINADAQYQYGSAFCEGINNSGITTAGSTVRNCSGKNSAYNNRSPLVYWNGDGFDFEGFSDGIVWTGCYASGNDDGGYDSKENNATVNDFVSEMNKYNYRIWGTGSTFNRPISRNPVKNGGTDAPHHFGFFGANASTIVINNPVIRGAVGSDAPAFYSGKTATLDLTINNYDIQIDTAAGAQYFVDGSGGLATVTWNPPLP